MNIADGLQPRKDSGAFRLAGTACEFQGEDGERVAAEIEAKDRGLSKLEKDDGSKTRSGGCNVVASPCYTHRGAD